MSATPSSRAASGADTIGDVIVRDATVSDAEAIAAIYDDQVLHGTASFETEAPGAAEMARRLQTLRDAGYPYLAAERGGEVLGYAYASAYRPRPAYRNTVENSVYLRREAAGRGIGSLLLTALIAACEARGYRQMIAVVGGTDNVASIRLHERMGFRLVGTLRSVGYKHDRWLDTVLLQRSLGDGDTASPLRDA